MARHARNTFLKVQRIYEVKQNDNISFGLIAFFDKEINEMYRFIFWLFSQEKTNEYRVENYIGNSYQSLVETLGISEVEACELLIRKLEFAKSLGFRTVINETIERRVRKVREELRKAKGREKVEVLKNGL